MPVALAALLLAGCYNPNAETGVPCSENFSCPGDQECDRTHEPPICVDELPDAGVPGGDGTPIACADGCPVDQPICDTGICRGCIADAECPSAVCHELVGTCVGEGETIFMSPNGSTTANCTPGQPCSTFAAAFPRLTAMRRFIRLEDGTYTGLARLDSTTVDVVISGADRDPPGAILTVTSGRIVDANAGSLVTIEGVTFQGATDSAIVSRGDLTLVRVAVANSKNTGIDVRGGKLRMDRVTVADGDAVGVVGGGGSIEMRSSIVSGNLGGGIDLQGGSATIVNSAILANGTASSNISALRVQSGSLIFQFNTVAHNVASVIGSGAVSCQAQQIMLEDSIFADNGTGSQIGFLCGSRFSLFSPMGPLTGGTNNIVAAPMFDSAQGFHITAGSPAKDAADPMATEARDIDGDLRGSARDMGADELP